jgi:hypothetical protein
MTEPRLKDWREVIGLDFPEVEITDATVQNAVQMSQRGYRTDMRIATGRVWTDKDYETRRAKILSTPLP